MSRIMINPSFQPSQTQSGLLTRCGSMSTSYASGPKIDPCIPHMSLVVRKPAFCICENKDTDQLCGDREADQRLCFPYTDSTIPFLPKSEFQASRHLLWLYSPACVGPGRKPRRPVFSWRGSYILSWKLYFPLPLIQEEPVASNWRKKWH